MYTYFLKRTIDFSTALVLLILISPIFLVITLFLTFSNKGNPIFIQKRPGKNEKPFYILKFKTMNNLKDKKGDLLPDKNRLTPIGRFVRKTSLDEIPQLINVIKGEMSFIGPRPLLIRYLPYYKEQEKLRHSVRPGITGLAQVSGRNVLPWDERLATDVYYVRNRSLLLDIKIIAKTIKNVIISKDVITDPNSVIQDLDECRKKD